MDEKIPFDVLMTDLKDSIPAADVAPVVHGVDLSPCNNGKWFRCSVCGFGFNDYYSNDERMMNSSNNLNYCPNCGAKMDGGTAK